MSMRKNSSDFKAMNVAELKIKKKYLQDCHVSVSGYLKPSLVEIASAVERMVLLVDPNFEKDQRNTAGTLIIHDMFIPHRFSLHTVNNFNSLPPFWITTTINKDSPLTSHLMTIDYSLTVMWNPCLLFN